MIKKNIIGNRVSTARRLEKTLITQSDLAARLQTCGVMLEQADISKIESGSRGVYDYELLALAKVLHVSVNWLLGEETNDGANNKVI